MTKDTAIRKKSIITIKNEDTNCLATSIVPAFANLKPENWSKTQLQDGFNKSRKLQKNQALKLHENANVKINEYGNDLNDLNKCANYMNIEINIIDSEQFNEIIYPANKECEAKIYLYKTRNRFDVVKSMTAFYSVLYYCHDCKKKLIKKRYTKMLIKMFILFLLHKRKKM